MSQIQGQTLDILWVFFYSVKNFSHRNLTQPHDGWITNPPTRWFHHTVGFSFFLPLHFSSSLSTDTHPTIGKTTGLINSWVFPFLPRTSPTSTDRQRGVSFQSTPMGKITHTHSPRTGGEFSTTYLRVRAYSPRTGIRSKCLQLSP